MDIVIVSVGKVKDNHLASLCNDYAERIQHYGHSISVLEVKEEPGGRPDGMVVEKESARIAERIPAGAWTVAMDLRGEVLTSTRLASTFSGWINDGIRTVCFLIGGQLGLSRELVSSCRMRLALSRLTLTHEMARMVLLEQLYRANTIIRGEPYHK